MQPWLARLRAWWKKVFFWKSKPTGSQEFVPHDPHDHTLVFTVTESAKVPRWHQWRYFTRAFSRKEQKRFLIACLIAFLAFGLGTGNLLYDNLKFVPKIGGGITEGLIGTPKLINPAFTSLNDVDRDLAALIYSGLFRLDENLNPQPDLADQYEWKENGRVLEIRLRQDVLFHDGEPLTPNDIVFTYQTLKPWKSPLAKIMTGVRVTRGEGNVVRFQLDKPDPNFLSFLTIGILPAHLWENVPESHAMLAENNLKPVGSGPYQAVSFTRDSKGDVLSYRLRLFSRYYGSKPFIHEWTFRFYADRLEAENAIRGGQIDSLAFIPWGDVQTIKNKNLQSLDLELPQETIAFLNTKQGALKDLKVRQALLMALDREELSQLIGPHASAVSSPFPFLESATGTLPDMEDARALLASLGWKLLGDDPIRYFNPPIQTTGTKKGSKPAGSQPTNSTSTPLTLTIFAPKQTDVLKVADWLKRRWSLIGVKVEVRAEDPSLLLEKILTDRTYHVALWNILLPENQDLKPFWGSGNAGLGGFNLSNLEDRDVDIALEKIKSATSTEALLENRRAFSDLLLTRHAAAFLLRPAYAYLVSERIKGTTNQRISRPSERLLAAKNWYIQTRWEWK